MENEMIFDLIKALDSVRADDLRAMFDFERDGRKFWLHIDLHEIKEPEPEEE